MLMNSHLRFQEVDSRKRPAGDGAGAGKAGAPPTLTLAGVPDDAALVCRSAPDPRSNAVSWTVTMTQSHRYHPYPSILLPVQSQSSDLETPQPCPQTRWPSSKIYLFFWTCLGYLLLQEAVPVYPSQGS